MYPIHELASTPAEIHTLTAVARITPIPRTGHARASGVVRQRGRRGPKRFLGVLFLALAAVGLLAPVGASGQAAEASAAEPPLNGISSVVTGDHHSCAVTTDHHLRCWGENESGELGVGAATDDPELSARTVIAGNGQGPLTGVTAVAAGYAHTCALLVNQQVRCWGSNAAGQLGTRASTGYTHPVVVGDAAGGPLRGVTQISAEGQVTCAVLVNGQVRCWGSGDNGQIGDGTDSGDHNLPTPVLAVTGVGRLTKVTQVEVGAGHVCARLTSGEARCWGRNDFGELGDGSTQLRTRPVVVRNGSGTGPLVGVRRITAGGRHTCAVRTDGTARCWGEDTAGQLGDGRGLSQSLPVTVVRDAGRAPLRGIATVDAGYQHSCARLTNGQVRCWGENAQDQLGNGIEAGGALSLPSTVRNRLNTGSLVGVAQIETRTHHTCVVLTNRQVRCWGLGTTGALGNGGTTSSPLPVTVVREPEA